MKWNAGVALEVLALFAGSVIAAPLAQAEDVPAETAAAEWQRTLEARLDEDARTIAASIADDAMAAASKIDLSARLSPADSNADQVLMANKL